MSPIRELKSLRVRIDKLVYDPRLEAPPEQPHPFAYHITIDNGSEETVTIKGRKWIVTTACGTRQVIEGAGVVGKFPRLLPGQQFSYCSYHTIADDSVAEGAFLGISDDGQPLVTRIPPFEMKVPQNL